MKAFADLYRSLDETTSINRKIDAMVEYFRLAPEEDAIWAVSFLIGRKPRQVVPTRKLMQWAAELAEVPEWLFEASYDVVGDLADTIETLKSLSCWEEMSKVTMNKYTIEIEALRTAER